MLLWFYVFVITVVMVNLLIAQMGSAYRLGSGLGLGFGPLTLTLTLARALIRALALSLTVCSKLEELGPLIQNHNTVTMCIEYKDLQDSLPPPLNVLPIRTRTLTV